MLVWQSSQTFVVWICKAFLPVAVVPFLHFIVPVEKVEIPKQGFHLFYSKTELVVEFSLQQGIHARVVKT